QIVDDRQAFPYSDVAVPQDRHLAIRRRELGTGPARVPRIVIERRDDLLERQPRLPDREPAAQRPAAIRLVADEEPERHGSAFRLSHRAIAERDAVSTAIGGTAYGLPQPIALRI